MKLIRNVCLSIMILIIISCPAIAATITAAGAGNWSAVGTWNGGVVPGNGDTADLNGFVVVMDIATIPASGTLLAITSPAKAGQLTLALDTVGSSVINATTITPGTVGAGGFIAVTGATANTFTWNGTTINGGGTASGHGIYYNSTGPCAINGNLLGGTASAAHAFTNQSTATVTVTGNITGGTANNTHGLHNNSTGAVVVVGNLSGGAAAANAGNGVYNNSTGAVTLTGNITGGSGTYAPGLSSQAIAPTLNSCNMINGTKSVAYTGYPPVWNLVASNYQQWGAVNFAQELAANEVLSGVVNGTVTGTLQPSNIFGTSP